MAPMIYSLTCSLGGYIEDPDGSLDWSAPDAEVHAFVNDRQRSIGTYLYGRRMYETMRVWQDFPPPGAPAEVGDFAELWRAARKIVFSSGLPEATTPRTEIRRRLDASTIREILDAADGDV